MGNLVPAEIRTGLFLTLLPETLVAHGGVANCEPKKWVVGPHSFLCLYATSFNGRWLPLYSQITDDRKQLPLDGRAGHQEFWVTNPNFYFFPGQVWTASHQAVIAAAEGHDFSSKGKRNTLARRFVPKID